MSSRFVSPFYDVGSGIKPSSGSKLFFFETDGTTPKNTFSDQLSTPTANTNPVIADSNGVFGNIFITGAYKVTLQDKNGSQLFGLATVDELATVQDNAFVKNFLTLEGGPAATSAVENLTLQDGDAINASDRTTGNGGGALWDAVLASTVTPNTFNIVICTGVPTLALVLRRQGFFNAREYGATGDNATDDTGAMQKVIDDVTLQGGALYIPAGMYKVTGLVVKDVSFVDGVLRTSRTKIYGDGQETRIIGTTTAPVLTVGDQSGFRQHDVEFRDMHIDGDATALTCIRIENSTRLRFDNLRIYNATGDGVLLTASSFGPHMFINCMMRENGGNGFFVDDSSANNGNNTKLIGCIIGGNGGAGVKVNASFDFNLIGTDIEGNGDSGIIVGDGTQGVQGFMISGGYIEAHNGGLRKSGIALEDLCQSATIQGVYINLTDNLTQVSGIFVSRSRALDISGNTITGRVSAGVGIYFDDVQHDCVNISCNFFSLLADNVRYPTDPTNILRLTAMGSGTSSDLTFRTNASSIEGRDPFLIFRDVDETDQVIKVISTARTLRVQDDIGTDVFSIKPYDTPFVRAAFQFLNPTTTTAGRPTAIQAGSQMYDTDLSIPIWWNGSVWKDASGSTV